VLNNLDVSSEYIIRLKSEIETKTIAIPTVGQHQPERVMFPKPEDQEKLKIALADLLEVSKLFKQSLEVSFPLQSLALLSLSVSPCLSPSSLTPVHSQTCMEEFQQSLQPRTRSLLDLFGSVNYELTEQEYHDHGCAIEFNRSLDMQTMKSMIRLPNYSLLRLHSC
jgi:hypothetical protein